MIRSELSGAPPARALRGPAAALLLLAAGLPACARVTGERGMAAVPSAAAAAVSAPVRDLRYEVTAMEANLLRRQLRVVTTFAVDGTAPVLLSLPAWTPGAYEISNYARNVIGFGATQGGRPLQWDKVDPDTWRVRPTGAGEVQVTFDYRADSLDNAMSWARRDFVFFNGTNIFLYPEGHCCDFAATVSVRTEADWKVATGMRPAGAPRTYREANYHDLVDMPFFVGRFDLDSMEIAGRTTRLATYPVGAIAGERRAKLWDDHRRMIPPMLEVFGDTAYDSYTTMIAVVDGQGSALEHQNSHLGLYDAGFLGEIVIPSITAHEIFHLWNVKRLRPVELWPYRYDVAQPTTLLWMSEGITDYYADLALVRGGIVDSAGFLALTEQKMQNVAATRPVALEDASLSTWIHPVDGTAYIYYDKGSLVGFLLDVLIRDASDNRGSLDDVMRTLYREHYQRGRGFSDAEFWATVSRVAGGRSFDEERRRYVDGREPFPWDRVLPLAGLQVRTDTLRVPLLGIQNQQDSAGVRVSEVDPAGAAARAGVRAGDYLVSVGDVEVEDLSYGAAFRTAYANRAGEPLRIVVRRDGRTLTLTSQVTIVPQVRTGLAADPNATEKARRVRSGIFHGGR